MRLTVHDLYDGSAHGALWKNRIGPPLRAKQVDRSARSDEALDAISVARSGMDAMERVRAAPRFVPAAERDERLDRDDLTLL